MKLLIFLICLFRSVLWLCVQTSAENPRYLIQGNIVVAEKDTNGQLENCLGKVKSSLGLYKKLRSRLDLAVRQARVDLILEIFKEKTIMLCTPSEAQVLLQYLKKYMQASTIVTKIRRSLTKSERSELNTWRELDDTDAETKFFLRKYKELPDSEHQLLKSAFTELMNTFIKSSLRQQIAEFLVTLTPDKINMLKAYGKAGKTNLIRQTVNEETNDLKGDIRQEILDFSEQLFSLDED